MEALRLGAWGAIYGGVDCGLRFEYIECRSPGKKERDTGGKSYSMIWHIGDSFCMVLDNGFLIEVIASAELTGQRN
jgi:hypothetical protein